MMKSFACGDVVPGCEARWVCSTEDEILFIVAEHAAAAHGVPAMTPELDQAVRSAVVAVG